MGDRLRGNRRGRASHGAGRAGKGERESWIYGRRPVIEVLLAGRRQIHELRMAATPSNRTDDELAVILDEARRAGIAVRSVPRDDLEELTDGGNHQGVAIRTSSYPYAEFDQILETVRDDPAAIVLLLLLGGSGWVEERSNQWGPLQSLFAGVEIESRELVVPRDQTESLELTLDPGQFGARLHTDIGGNDLLAGTVFYARELAYDVREDGAERAITIRDRSGNVPGLWMSDMSAHRWDLGVNPEVPLALVVDGGSGPVELSLADASLERLVLDGGSGAAAVTLPPREVELNADGASGSLSLQVPAGGRLSGSLDLGSGATTLQAAARSRLSLRLEAGSGSVRISLGDDAAAELDLVDAGSGAFALSLPRSAAVRVVVDEGGSGGLSLPRELRQISDGHDNDPDTGEWQTDGYEEATVRVQLRVRNMGSGAVSVRFG